MSRYEFVEKVAAYLEGKYNIKLTIITWSKDSDLFEFSYGDRAHGFIIRRDEEYDIFKNYVYERINTIFDILDIAKERK